MGNPDHYENTDTSNYAIQFREYHFNKNNTKNKIKNFRNKFFRKTKKNYYTFIIDTFFCQFSPILYNTRCYDGTFF